jgi:coenzyme PQQ precursor peptide PqqA
MEWEKPEFVEISLACEISSYANAELGDSPTQEEGRAGTESK